jgi:hypothetical protein
MRRRLKSEGMGRSQRWLRIEPPNAKLCVSADIVNLFCAIQFSQASGDLHTVAVGGPPASQHVDLVSFIYSKYEGPRLKFGGLRTVRSR